MAKLIYSAIMSLDGYIADEHGNFDWAEPDEEVLAFINNLERLVGSRRGGWIDSTDRGRAHVSRGLVSISGHRGDASPRVELEASCCRPGVRSKRGEVACGLRPSG